MDTQSSYFIIYPERRWVSEAKIRMWYGDAVANGEVDDRDYVRVSDMVAALDDAGIITCGRPRAGE